jgi:hypothetical protein
MLVFSFEKTQQETQGQGQKTLLAAPMFLNDPTRRTQVKPFLATLFLLCAEIELVCHFSFVFLYNILLALFKLTAKINVKKLYIF